MEIFTMFHNDNGHNDGTEEQQETYDFIGNAGPRRSNEINFSVVGNRWDLGSHSTTDRETQEELSEAITETMEQLDEDIDDEMVAVLQDASNLVNSVEVTKFECPVEECGLGHSHPDHKHDIRESFSVTEDFASQMQFCPYCHCGVNELRMLVAFFPYIDIPVFEDQHQFEGVLEVDPEMLESIYREYDSGLSVSRAVSQVAERLGVEEIEVAPMGVRPDLKKFFYRRKNIEKAADAAPIAEQTRNVISENRRAANEVVDQSR